MKRILSLIIILSLCGTIQNCKCGDETGLRVIRGVITNWSKFDKRASVLNPFIQSGKGFSVKGNNNNRDRKMLITFDKPFKDNPAITVTPNIRGDAYGQGSGSWNQTCQIWQEGNIGDLKKSFWVRCDANTKHQPSMATQIGFIAIGK